MKAIIVDDNPKAIELLQRQLQRYDDVQVVGTANNAADGLRLAADKRPDVLFLDVEMPGMSGLDFLEEMDGGRNGSPDCDVVMCTAYDDYMLPSFRGNAFDFLLKPVGPDELDVVVRRLRTSQAKRRQQAGSVAPSNSVRRRDEESFIFYTNAVDFRLVRLRDIGIFKYNHELRAWEVVVADRKDPIRLKRSISSEQILALDDNFYQVNQKYVINIRYLFEVKDNICFFYPPFDGIDYVKVGRFFRRRFIEQFNRL